MIISIRKKINSALFKQTAILSFGTLISQLIALSITLILQRYYYSPAQFGEYNLFINITSVFASIATLKYEYAVMISKDEIAAKHLFLIAIISSLLMSFVAIFFIAFLQYFEFIDIGGIMIFILVFLLVFFSGINDVINNWFNRSKLYINMAFTRILQSLVGEGAKIAFYFTPLSQIAMQIGRVIGFGFSGLFLLLFKFKDFKAIVNTAEISKVKEYALSERKYPLITTPNVLVNSLNAAVFSYSIFEFYGASKLGFVSVAMQYVAVPLGIVSSSFGQIYFQSISEIKNKYVLRKHYINNIKSLALIALLALIVIMLLPEEIFTLVLGEKWSGIGPFFRICIFYMSFSFISSSVSFIYLKLDKHKLLLYFSISQLLLTFLSLHIPNNLGYGLMDAFICFASFQALYYLVCIGLGWHLLKKEDE
jgi:O-antigen/teichoic acid export membrane protein